MQSSSASGREISVLNQRKIDPAPKSWGDALNRALSERVGEPANDVSAKPLTEAQKLQMHAGLNHRLKATVAGSDLSQRKLASGAERAHAVDAVPDSAPRPELNEKLAAKAPESFEKTAQTLVNQFFMGTMLKQMRQSPFADGTFTGGRAGEAYASLFDQHVAEHAGNKVAKSLVASMVRHYQKKPTSVPVIRHEPALAVTA